MVILWCLGPRFLGVKFFLDFEIYFGVGYGNAKATTRAKAIGLVASPCGLRSGLRQSGSAFRRGLFVGLKPHANPKGNKPTLIRKATTHANPKGNKATTKRKADPPPSAKDDKQKT